MINAPSVFYGMAHAPRILRGEQPKEANVVVEQKSTQGDACAGVVEIAHRLVKISP